MFDIETISIYSNFSLNNFVCLRHIPQHSVNIMLSCIDCLWPIGKSEMYFVNRVVKYTSCVHPQS